MPKWSDERRREVKALIRKYLIMDPKIGIIRLANLIGIDKDTAQKYTKIVRKERAERIEKEIKKLREKSVEEALVETEEEFTEIMTRLWMIANKKDASRSDKIRALKELRDTKKDLLGMMFDAGLFRKHGDAKQFEIISLFQQALDEDTKEEENKYESMGWGELRKKASSKDLYEVGMTKDEVIKALMRNE